MAVGSGSFSFKTRIKSDKSFRHSTDTCSTNLGVFSLGEAATRTNRPDNLRSRVPPVASLMYFHMMQCLLTLPVRFETGAHP